MNNYIENVKRTPDGKPYMVTSSHGNVLIDFYYNEKGELQTRKYKIQQTLDKEVLWVPIKIFNLIRKQAIKVLTEKGMVKLGVNREVTMEGTTIKKVLKLLEPIELKAYMWAIKSKDCFLMYTKPYCVPNLRTSNLCRLCRKITYMMGEGNE